MKNIAIIWANPERPKKLPCNGWIDWCIERLNDEVLQFYSPDRLTLIFIKMLHFCSSVVGRVWIPGSSISLFNLEANLKTMSNVGTTLYYKTRRPFLTKRKHPCIRSPFICAAFKNILGGLAFFIIFNYILPLVHRIRGVRFRNS